MTAGAASGATDIGERRTSVVVVGVDHSAGGREALRFALVEAQLRRATLRAVHAWQLAYVGVRGFGGGVPAFGEDVQELRVAAEETLDATLRDAIPDTGGVDVERRIVEGTPAPCSSRSPGQPIFSWSGPAGTAALLSCCSGR
jgi:hypothetical protein